MGRRPSVPAAPRRPATRPAGHWLPPRTRAALGHELLATLEPREDVALVVPVWTWASPRTVIAVTDRRLLWLLDDAVLNRVRSVRFRDVARVERRLSWPRRHRATVHLRGRYGSKQSFAGLSPADAAHIVAAVEGGRGKGQDTSG